MRRILGFGLLVTGVMALVGLSSGTASAQFVIAPTFAPSITSDSNAAAIEGVINSAISVYESKFVDPITVNINFAEGGGLGSSSTYFANVSYQSYITALRADATSASDTTAISLLPVTTINPVDGSTTINVKTANLRAVGIAANPPSGQPDGYITLNTNLTDIGSKGTSGQYSLLAVAEHEIDEVLGLGSGLPDSSPFAEDLFRYTSAGARTFTTSSSVKAYFSINGTTDLAQFDNQNDGGDFADWQSNPLPGGVGAQVQDAFATPGSKPTLGVNEITALDVIGYTLKQSPAAGTPEPGTIALLFSFGVVGAGSLLRRKISRK